MSWKPHVTVAAVLECDGKFLMVEEETDDGIRFNQPAGHLECRESLSEAVIREVLEETGRSIVPEALVGIYNWRNERKDITYLRFVFTGRITAYDSARPLDQGIITTHWLSLEEIRAQQALHRSPMVLQCVEDFCAGKRAPLELITHYPC